MRGWLYILLISLNSVYASSVEISDLERTSFAVSVTRILKGRSNGTMMIIDYMRPLILLSIMIAAIQIFRIHSILVRIRTNFPWIFGLSMTYIVTSVVFGSENLGCGISGTMVAEKSIKLLELRPKYPTCGSKCVKMRLKLFTIISILSIVYTLLEMLRTVRRLSSILVSIVFLFFTFSGILYGFEFDPFHMILIAKNPVDLDQGLILTFLTAIIFRFGLLLKHGLPFSGNGGIGAFMLIMLASFCIMFSVSSYNNVSFRDFFLIVLEALSIQLWIYCELLRGDNRHADKIAKFILRRI